MDLETPRAHHDLGGAPQYMCQEIARGQHVITDFDKEVDAIRQLLATKGLMTVDELRRGIEAIPEADYHRLSYYERWVRSISGILLEKGIIGEAELVAAMEAEQ